MASSRWLRLLSLGQRRSLSFPVQCLDGQRFPKLVDRYGRVHSYLRISLTERCNLNCSYCMPMSEHGPDRTKGSMANWTIEELQFLTAYFVQRGVNKVRLTGGEPLLRRDLPELIASLNELRHVNDLSGLGHISMTTNGTTFTRRAAELRAAGLDSVNISLDSLRPERVRRLTGFAVLKHALSAIYAALEHGYNPVKVNCVVIRGFNEDELGDFVQMTHKLPIEVRFIEYMPFGGNRWDKEKLFPFVEMLSHIHGQYPELERIRASADSTAKLYRIAGWAGTIGLITSMTANFCNTCTRLRVTADGHLKTCLHDSVEVDLRSSIRNMAPNGIQPEALLRWMSNCENRLPGDFGRLLDRLDCLVDEALMQKKKEHADIKDAISFKGSQREMKINAFRALLSVTVHIPVPTVTHFIRFISSYGGSHQELTHLSQKDGGAKMVDTTNKAVANMIAPSVSTVRWARAEGKVKISETIKRILSPNTNETMWNTPKGNVVQVARIAGIQAAKQTCHLIPLCHQVLLTNVQIDFSMEDAVIRIRSVAKAVGQATGVEMEALTAVTVAALTIYDMLKSIEPGGIVISRIELLEKHGGKSGSFAKQTSSNVQSNQTQKNQ